MKIQKLLIIILILSVFFSGSIQAQSKSESENAKEEKIRELEKQLEQALKLKEADLEKALQESKKLQSEELRKALENQHKVQQRAMEQYKKAWDVDKEAIRDNWKDNREFFDRKEFDKAFKNHSYKIISPPDVGVYFEADDDVLKGIGGTYISSSRDRTALTIKKELDDVTFDTKFKYEVSEGSRGINFKVEGSMNEGTLYIKLVKPDGKVLQEIEISPLADISWNQDLRWDEEEDQEKGIGNWLIVVSAKGASGKYSVNVRAN